MHPHRPYFDSRWFQRSCHLNPCIPTKNRHFWSSVVSKWVRWGYGFLVGIDRGRYFTLTYYLSNLLSLTRPFDQTSLNTTSFSKFPPFLQNFTQIDIYRSVKKKKKGKKNTEKISFFFNCALDIDFSVIFFWISVLVLQWRRLQSETRGDLLTLQWVTLKITIKMLCESNFE